MSGFLYAIGNGSSVVKLGFSANPPKRAMQLQIGSPDPLRLIGVVPGTPADEAVLKRDLAPWKRRGEWFALEGRVSAFVSTLMPWKWPTVDHSGPAATFADVIDRLGGYRDVAEHLGVSPGSVSSMRSRRSIPSEHWHSLAILAADLGRTEITIDALAQLRPPRKPRGSRTLPTPEPAPC